jgi:O-antigen/teichoic acid export membrane protein
MSAVLTAAEGIEHRAAKVTLVNGLSTVLTLAFQLVSVPVCLRYWGKETYGSWIALMSAFMAIRALDGGFVLYVGNKLNYLYHKDGDALSAHLSSAITGIVIIGSLELLLAIGALVFRPLANALGMPYGHPGGPGIQIGLLLLILSWVLTGSYLGIVHRLLIPAGMMYQSAWWTMVFQVAQFGAIMAAAVLRLTILETSLLFALVQVVTYVASAIYVRMMLPRFYPWLRSTDIALGLTDLRQSMALTGSNFIQQGTTNGVVLIVSSLAGPAAVPLFTTVRTVTNLWTAVTTVLTTPLLPDVVRIHAKEEFSKLIGINETYWVLVGSIVNLGALFLYPLIPLLYSTWTAHSVTLNRPLLCFMLASVIATNSGALMALHLNGINSLGVVLRTSLARALFGLGLGVVGFGRLGIASFGLGILAGELSATLLTARHFVKYELHGRGLHLSASAFAPAILGAGSAIVFFVGAGFRWWTNQWALPIAITLVAAASVWGWTALDESLRSKLTRLAARWLYVGKSM